MVKIDKILGSIMSIVIIIDISLKYTKVPDVSFLTAPILSLNILQLLVFLILTVLIYRFLPNKLSRIKLRIRAETFWKNWKKFKNILIAYSKNPDERLQGKYEKIREKLEIDFNFFLPSIRSIQQATHRKNNELSISNFELCIRETNICRWETNVRRKIPDEINCFDYLIIALKEDCKKPERK